VGGDTGVRGGVVKEKKCGNDQGVFGWGKWARMEIDELKKGGIPKDRPKRVVLLWNVNKVSWLRGGEGRGGMGIHTKP